MADVNRCDDALAGRSPGRGDGETARWCAISVRGGPGSGSDDVRYTAETTAATSWLDTRAVSPVFAYVLTLGIATMLVGGLIVSAGGYVDDQRRQTAKSELHVVGQQISADIAAADRLVRTGGGEDVRVGRTIPQSVVGSTFTVKVVDGGGPTSPYLELSTIRPDVTVTVGLVSKTPVEVGTSADGGRVVVAYDGSKVVMRSGN